MTAPGPGDTGCGGPTDDPGPPSSPRNDSPTDSTLGLGFGSISRGQKDFQLAPYNRANWPVPYENNTSKRKRSSSYNDIAPPIVMWCDCVWAPIYSELCLGSTLTQSTK